MRGKNVFDLSRPAGTLSSPGEGNKAATLRGEIKEGVEILLK